MTFHEVLQTKGEIVHLHKARCDVHHGVSWVLCKYSPSKSVRAVSDPESNAENGNTTNQFGALLGDVIFLNQRENSTYVPIIVYSTPLWWKGVVAVLSNQNGLGVSERWCTLMMWKGLVRTLWKTTKVSHHNSSRQHRKSKSYGEFGNRTRDFVHAKHALYQLS